MPAFGVNFQVSIYKYMVWVILVLKSLTALSASPLVAWSFTLCAYVSATTITMSAAP